jgi:predicted O-methyltransferase YrrM
VTVPPLVARAKVAAGALGLEMGCRDEDGMLLHVLAGRRGVERVAEIGTGTGVGTAWLASALPPGIPLVTVQLEQRFAGVAAELFAADPDVDVLHGDWREVLPAHAPFDLLVVHAGRARGDPDAVLALAAPGATIVLDDFSSGRQQPASCRETWLAHPRLAAVEIGTGQTASVIVSVLRR